MKLTALPLLAIAFLVTASPVLAQRVWTGGGTGGNWDDAANWGGTAPVATNSLTFTGTNQTSTTNNFAADTRFDGLTFNNSSTAGSFTLAGNRITLGANITLSGNTGVPTHEINLDMIISGNRAIFLASQNSVRINGVISESGSRGLTVQGGGLNGRATLNGLNTFTGTPLIAGWAVVNTLADAGVASSLGAGTGSIRLSSGNNAANLIYAGTAPGGHSTDRALLLGGTNNVGATIYADGAGPVTFNAPSVLFTNGTAAKTLTLRGTSTANNTIASSIGNEGAFATSLQKEDAGTWILSGSNSYTGLTTVTAGSLLVNGTNSGTGAVTVAAGATLGGSGTIAGATTISGIHNPGNSPGVQTFGDNLTYAGASPTVVWELTANTTTQGSPTPVFDQIIVGGNLDFSVPTTLTLSFDFTGSSVDWSNALWNSNITGTAGWLVYDVSGTLGNFNNLSLSAADWADGQGDLFNTVRAGSSFSLYQDGNDIYLNYAVPEPSTYALLALTAAGLGAHVIRRRRLRSR